MWAKNVMAPAALLGWNALQKVDPEELKDDEPRQERQKSPQKNHRRGIGLSTEIGKRGQP